MQWVPSANHVDIFWQRTEGYLDDRLAICLNYLSDDELIRARRISRVNQQQQFILTRGLLRQLIGQALNISPKSVVFFYQNYKPNIRNNYKRWPVSFNVSHCMDLTVIALTLNRSLGVDIEKLVPRVNFLALVKRYFHHSESAEIIAQDKSEQYQVFYRYWVAKEAFAKVVGVSIFNVLSYPVFQQLSKTFQYAGDSWVLSPLLDRDGFFGLLSTRAPAMPIREHIC